MPRTSSRGLAASSPVSTGMPLIDASICLPPVSRAAWRLSALAASLSNIASAFFVDTVTNGLLMSACSSIARARARRPAAGPLRWSLASQGVRRASWHPSRPSRIGRSPSTFLEGSPSGSSPASSATATTTGIASAVARLGRPGVDQVEAHMRQATAPLFEIPPQRSGGLAGGTELCAVRRRPAAPAWVGRAGPGRSDPRRRPGRRWNRDRVLRASPRRSRSHEHRHG